MRSKIKNILDPNSGKMLFVLIFIYLLIFFVLSLKKLHTFDYNLLDLSIFNQVFFNTLHGRWLMDTVNVDIYLADHFTPIIFALLPFYWLRQSADFLLFVQTLILALSAWPLYLIAKDATKNNLLSLLVTILWLGSPFVQSTNLLEFHLLPLATFFIFWTFYFYRRHKFGGYVLFFVLTLLVREDISFIMLAFGWLAYLDRRSFKWRLTGWLLPLIYFVVSYQLIAYFAPSGSNKFLIYYGWAGGSDLLTIILSWLKEPWLVLTHIFTMKNLLGVSVLFLPVLFLPLIRPKYLSLALLPFLQILLTSKSFDFSAYSSHYVMLFLPGLFIALIFALAKIERDKNFQLGRIVRQNRAIAGIILTTTVFYFMIFLSPLWPVLAYQPEAKLLKNKQAFLDLIPKDAKVLASSSFLPELSSRPVVYPVFYAYFGKNQFARRDFVLPQVDYILVDFSEFLAVIAEKNTAAYLAPYRQQMPEDWRKLLSEDYHLIKARDNIYLWQADELASATHLKLYESFFEESESADHGLLSTWQMESADSTAVLKITFQKKATVASELLIRFYQDKNYYDLPVDYGLLPISDWPQDAYQTFYYYPDDTVDSFQVFSWIGEEKLGHRKELVLDSRLYPETEKIILSLDRE